MLFVIDNKNSWLKRIHFAALSKRQVSHLFSLNRLISQLISQPAWNRQLVGPGKINLPNLRVIKGNVRDYASVGAAMRGQNAVVSALGHKRLFYPTKILSEGTRNILRAMKACDVPRFICESSLGVGNAVGRLGLIFTFFVIPVILPFYFWDRVRQEKLVEESDVDWVIVRPGALNNQPARGAYRHGPSVGNFILTRRISRADVANFMLKQLTDDD